MGPHFSRGYSDRLHFVQSLKRSHFSYSWQKNNENKEIRSQIKNYNVIEKFKKKVSKKNQEEIKIKNKVNVERPFMYDTKREREIYLYWSKFALKLYIKKMLKNINFHIFHTDIDRFYKKIRSQIKITMK